MKHYQVSKIIYYRLKILTGNRYHLNLFKVSFISIGQSMWSQEKSVKIRF